MGMGHSTSWQSTKEETESYSSLVVQPESGVAAHSIVKNLHFEKNLQFCFEAKWKGNGPYLIEVYRDNTLEWTKYNANTESLKIDNCVPSSKYKVIVHPRNHQGFYTGVPISRIFWTEPTPICGLRVKEDKGKIILSWDQPHEDNVTYEIQKYKATWLRWVFLGQDCTDESYYWLKSPTPGESYLFTILARNSHGLVGKKEEICKTSTGKYKVKFCVMKKEPNDITVLYDLDEDRLNSSIRNRKNEGYVRICSGIPTVKLYSYRSYKSKLVCKYHSVRISPKDGHNFEDQLLFDGHSIRYNFVTRITERDIYVFEFKLEENGEVIRIEPFQINFAGSLPSARTTVQAGIAIVDGATGNLNISGGAFTVGRKQDCGQDNLALPVLEPLPGELSDDSGYEERPRQMPRRRRSARKRKEPSPGDGSDDSGYDEIPRQRPIRRKSARKRKEPYSEQRSDGETPKKKARTTKTKNTNKKKQRVKKTRSKTPNTNKKTKKPNTRKTSKKMAKMKKPKTKKMALKKKKDQNPVVMKEVTRGNVARSSGRKNRTQTTRSRRGCGRRSGYN